MTERRRYLLRKLGSVDTPDGAQLLRAALRLGADPSLSHLSGPELLRLEYWGASGRRESTP